MSTNRKIQKVLVALIVGMLCAVPFWGSAQVEKGVTRAGESTKASPVKPYVNEFGKLVCWPRVNSNGKLLTYGPIADTEDADEITATTAKLHGNILHDGWCNPAGVTTQGFEISTTSDFTTIVKTVTLNPTPTFTPCATYPDCSCNGNKYSETVTELLPGTTYYYRAYATNDCGTGYGDTVQFKTDDDFEVIVTGPESFVFCITNTNSESATYTATTDPEISSGTKTYKWYVDGTLISGATSSTYTRNYTKADAGNHTVKCEVTVATLTKDGSKATAVTVINPTVNFTGITGPAEVCNGGGTVELTANASTTSPFTLLYSWNNGAYGLNNTISYSVSGTEPRTYTCKVQAINVSPVCASEPVEKTITINIYNPSVSNPYITPNTPTTICAGSSTTLTAHANVNPTTATVSYQWKKDGADISGATSATYNATEAGEYTCVITATQGSCSKSATPNATTVTVSTPSVGTIALAGQTICSGENAMLNPTISGSEGTLSYQWSTGGSDIPDATSASYTTPNLTAETNKIVNVTYTVNVTATIGSCTATGNASAVVKVKGPYLKHDTLEICDCQLPYTYNKNGWNVTWTAAELASGNKTKTRELTTAEGCDSVLKITLLTWSAANTENTACHNILNPNIREQDGMDGTDLYTLKDIDGNEYAVVQIGDQCWMKENLRVKKFDDGRANPDLSPVSDVDAHGNRADIYYVPSSGKVFTKNVCDQNVEIPFNSDYEKQYGLYYNWYTAMGTNNPGYNMHNVQGICPQGWHLPDTAEWQTLERAAGFYGQHSEMEHVFVGQSAIHLVTGCEWKQSTVANSPGDYNAFGRNDLNFSARPAGCFLDVTHHEDGDDYYKNTVAYTGIWTFFWSSTRYLRPDNSWPDGKAAYNYDIRYDKAGIARDVNGQDYLIGRSVRCVRDVSSMKVRINSKAETTSTSYTITGEVYELGSTTCAERGVCYATHTYPSVSDNKVTATGTPDLGTYTCVVPVTSGVKYYVRAYAKDAAGNYVYSNEVTVPDVCPSTTVQDGNGNNYETIAIGTQCWTRRSIHATKYADGTDITFGSPTSGDLYSSTTGYYYTPYINRGTLPGDAAGRITTWGYLYNWAAATRGVSGTNVQGVCPNGWHIPTIEDWTTLDNYVKGHYGCSNGSAQALSSVNTWLGNMTTCTPGYDAEHTNNQSGFNAYPAGIYNPASGYSGSPYNSSGNPTEPNRNGRYVNFWASNNNYYVAWGSTSTAMEPNNTLSDYKRFAFSVRCVKN